MEEVITNYKNILEKEPEFIKQVSNSLFYKYIMNSNYEPIFRVLREGPQTLSVIYNQYNQILLEKASDSKKKPSNKTENTVYKYVKKLIKEGFVIEAGIQVDMAKSSTITKTLYQLSAIYFIPDNNATGIFSSDIGNLLTEIVGVFISPHFHDKFPKIQEFKTLIANQFNDVNKKYIDFFKSLETIHKLPNEENEEYREAYKDLNMLSSKNYMLFFELFRNLMHFMEGSKADFSDLQNIFSQSESSTLRDSTIDIIDEKDSTKTVIKNDNFKQDLIMPVTEESWRKYFDKLTYHAIFKLLKTKAMSVHDIYIKHFETMKEIHEQQCCIADEYGKEMVCEEPTEIKSETTIYRYIKDLEEAGFLGEAGRLYSPSTKSSQILYARKSKIYIMFHTDVQRFDTDEGKSLLSVLNFYLRLFFHKTKSKVPNLKTNLLNFLETLNKAILNVYGEVKHDSIIESTRNLNPIELDLVLSLVSYFEFFIHSELYDSQEIINNLKNSFS